MKKTLAEPTKPTTDAQLLRIVIQAENNPHNRQAFVDLFRKLQGTDVSGPNPTLTLECVHIAAMMTTP